MLLHEALSLEKQQEEYVNFTADAQVRSDFVFQFRSFNLRKLKYDKTNRKIEMKFKPKKARVVDYISTMTDL